MQPKEACPCGRQYRVSTESKISVVFFYTGFWNSSKGPFILGKIPFGRLDLGWSLESNKALSLWSGSTDSKVLDKQRTNAAAAAAKSLTRLPCSWGSPGKNTGVGCHLLLQCMKVKSEGEVTQLYQSCPTPSDPMDCSPPGSSTHGIFQARILEWGAIAF